MPNYRRIYVPGGTCFFTVVTECRACLFSDESARKLLRKAFVDCMRRWPFQIQALVLLPEHWHTIWTLPEGDTGFSKRLAVIKKEFTKSWLGLGGLEQPRSGSRARNRRRGVWQRRFWDHLIRDEEDFARHFDYIHYNPVKHGHVRYPVDWPYSTFHSWVKRGEYPREWGCGPEVLRFDGLDARGIEIE
jgi:putative transposase